MLDTAVLIASILFLLGVAWQAYRLSIRTNHNRGWLLFAVAAILMACHRGYVLIEFMNNTYGYNDPINRWVILIVSICILWALYSLEQLFIQMQRTEERLRESERRFRCVTEALPLVLFTTNTRTDRFLLFEGRSADICGYSPEAFKSEPSTLKRIIPPEEHQRYLDTLASLQTYDGELSITHTNGQKRWIHIRAVPEVSPDGILLHHHGVMTDITERKRIQEALLESEERFRMLFNHVGDAVIIHDLEGRILEVNQEVCRRLGYSRSEFMNMTVRDIDTPEYAARVPQRMEQLRRKGFAVFESKHRCRDGAIIPVEISVRLFDFQGQPAVLSVCRDITERLKAQETLAQSEAHYRFLAENISNVIWRLDANLCFTYVTPSVERLLGYTPQECLSVSLEKFLIPESFSMVREAMEERLKRPAPEPERNETRLLELQGKRKDGSLIWLENHSDPLWDSQGNLMGFLGVTQDITARKMAESAVRESEEEQRAFGRQLVQMIQITNRFSKAGSFDELCRDAVEQGRELLGFDRLGFWLLTSDRHHIRGTYGVDEKGNLRDERQRIVPLNPGDDLHNLVINKSHIVVRPDQIMRNDIGEEVGRGPVAVAAVWDGAEVIGGIFADSFLTGQSFHDRQCELLTIYAADIGHLCSRKQAEEALKSSEESQREFGAQLVRLSGLTNQLSLIESFDDFCRSVVQQGKELLGFDRLGFWLLAEDGGHIQGTFGVDENGHLRDERGKRVPLDEAGYLRRVYHQKSHIEINPDQSMRDDQGREVGRGPVAVAAVWDGSDVIGGIFVDNYINRQPFSKHQCELLTIYSAAIGYLCSRKRAEAALRDSEKRLRSLYDGIDDAIFVHDETGRILDCNTAACRRLGFTRDELLQLKTMDIDAPEFSQGFEDRWRAQLAEGRLSCEGIHVTKSGRRIPVDVNTSIIDYEGRKAVLAVIRDISDRRRAEEQIRKLSQAVEQSPASVVITDVMGNMEYVNPKLCEVTGYEAHEVLGRNPRIFQSGYYSKDHYQAMWDTITSGRQWQGEFQNRRKNGDIYWEYAFISPIRNSEGVITHYLAVKEDITDRKAMEAQLLQAQKMEAIGQLAAGVAHDFNNLLTGILGNVSMVMVDLQPESEHYRMLGQADKAGRRAADLVRQLLAFGRRSPVSMKPIDLAVVMDEVAGIARNTFDRRIELAVRCKELLRPVQGDAGQMHNVLLNLCVNARDALEQVERTDPPPELRITLEAENIDITEDYSRLHAEAIPGRYVRLSVTDTGVGMSEELQKRIFEPFYTTKELGKGTGLGLAAVYGIVKQHNGWINVYSEIGKGSTFHIYLPAVISDGMEKESEERIRSVPRGSETILLVDDEEVIQNLGKAVLERLGYTVLLARDGKEGLQTFLNEREQVDLIILDLSMPMLSGHEVLGQIHAVDPGIPVILSSGYGMESQGRSLEELGAAGFVAKPYRLADLARIVRDVLDQKSNNLVG